MGGGGDSSGCRGGAADAPPEDDNSPTSARRRRRLLGWRNAEWLVTGPARLPAELLRDGFGGCEVLAPRGVPQLFGLHRVILDRGFELGPLLPDLGLGLGLLGQRALGKQRGDLCGDER